MARLWKQYREVQVDDVDLSDFTLDINVTMPQDDPLEYDLKVWNLTQDTWDQFDKDSIVQITLGWEDGERGPVIVGNIEDLSRSRDGVDWQYQFQGVDISAKAVKVKPARNWTRRSWRNTEPQAIVKDIADQLGLSARVDSVGAAIDGTFSITEAKKVSGWLDDLLEYAAELSGAEWEWFAEQGRLFFLRRDSTSGEAPKLSYDGLLLNMSKKSEDDTDVETLEFESMLDPRFRKGSAVVVDTERFSGAYKVKTYEYQSSSKTGDHLLRGDIEKADDITARQTQEERLAELQSAMEGFF